MKKYWSSLNPEHKAVVLILLVAALFSCWLLIQDSFESENIRWFLDRATVRSQQRQ